MQKTMLTMLPLAAGPCYRPWFLAWLSDCQAAMVGGRLTKPSCVTDKEGVNTCLCTITLNST